MDERCTCAATMAHGPATTQRMDTYLFDRNVFVGTLKEAPAASLKAGRDGGGNGNHHTLVALRSDRSAGGFVQGNAANAVCLESTDRRAPHRVPSPGDGSSCT